MGGGDRMTLREPYTLQRALPGMSTTGGGCGSGSERIAAPKGQPPMRCPEAMCASRNERCQVRWLPHGDGWRCWHCGEVVR